MESFNRGEHVVAAFLDVEKAFDNVWHNGLRLKIFQLDLPNKMTRWLSDFLVGRLIQVNVNNFLSSQINPKAGVPFTSMTFQHRTKNKTLYASSLMILLNGPSVEAYVRIAAKLLQQDLLKLAMWCAKWRIKLNPVKTKVIIFSRSALARKIELNQVIPGNLQRYVSTNRSLPQCKTLPAHFSNNMMAYCLLNAI